MRTPPMPTSQKIAEEFKKDKEAELAAAAKLQAIMRGRKARKLANICRQGQAMPTRLCTRRCRLWTRGRCGARLLTVTSTPG